MNVNFVYLKLTDTHTYLFSEYRMTNLRMIKLLRYMYNKQFFILFVLQQLVLFKYGKSE